MPFEHGRRRDALKVMAPIFLCSPMTLEADGGDMAVEVEVIFREDFYNFI